MTESGDEQGLDRAARRDRARRALRERRSRLNDDAIADLERRLRDAPTVPAADRLGPDRAVTTSAQRRMWLMEQLAPGTGAFNESLALRLKGPLDTVRLQTAFDHLLQRHEALRTGFDDRDGDPVPIVADEVDGHIDIVDLRDELEGALDRAVALAESEGRRPFALDAAPLLRATLVRLTDTDSILILVNHHIISDARSRQVLLNDLGHLYMAAMTGELVSAPAPARYSDFARLQQAALADHNGIERLLAHWTERLASALDLELPTDRVVPARRSYRGGRIRFSFGETETARIGALARDENATVFAVVLGAIGATLARFARQYDVVVGTAISGRPSPAFDDVIGFFVDTVALRLKMTRQMSFAELVAVARHTVLDGLSHAGLPFEYLVEALAPKRTAGETPLFRVMTSMQSVPEAAVSFADLDVELIPLETGTARFDLDIDIAEVSGRIDGIIEYNADLFDPATVQSMAAFLERFVSRAVGSPNRPLDDLFDAALQSNESVLLGPIVEFSEADDVIARFREQVRLDPSADAISEDGRNFMSVGQLCRRVEEIAAALAEAGVEPADRVAVAVPRGIDMVASLLACLWGGATAVPLDTRLPARRLDVMVERAGADVVIHRGLAAGTLQGVSRVDLEGVTKLVGPVPVTQQDLGAYLVFTSGSTGQPKGVLVTRANVANFLIGMDGILRDAGVTGSGATWLATTSVAFDMSVFDLFWPLVRGQRVIVHGAPARTGLTVAEAIVAGNVNCLQCTPSLLQMVADDPEGLSALQRLAVIVTGGEALPAQLLARVSAASAAQISTCYGPTETTVYSSGEWANPETGMVSLGRPMANTSFYVADDNGRRVPRGAVGELWIGGAGVAAGYLDAPELTDDRFRADSIGVWPGGRMYRSGDMVRVNGSGSLMFLGRRDHQVKLRGHRIELGEVEHAIRRLPAVQDAAVLLHDAGLITARLVAFVVGNDIDSPTSLRDQLSTVLPSYMVPSRWKFMSRLPRTHNEKLDRQALSAMLPEQVDIESNGDASTVERMAEVWGALLGIDRPSAEMDFFELGGHSLLAARLVAIVRDTFGVDVSLRELFELPTVGKFAELVESRLHDVMPLVAPERALHADLGARHEPFPLTDVQQAYWVGRSNLLGLGSVACHLYAEFELPALEVPRLEDAWNGVVARHDMLRAVIDDDGRQRILADVPRYRIEDSTLVETTTDPQALRLERRERMSHNVMRTDRWPLFELRVTRLNEQRSILHVSIDRLIADGESTRLALTELMDRYEGAAPVPVPLQVSFRDYVLHERAEASGDAIERALGYWRLRYSTLPGGPDIGLAADLATLQAARFVHREVTVGVDTWDALKRVASTMGITPSALLVTVYAEGLGRVARSPHFCVGLTMFDRKPLHPDVAQMVGDFTTVVPLEIADALAGTFHERALRTQARLWQDFDHRVMGSVRIHRDMQRRTGRPAPTIPVVFTSELGMDREMRLPDGWTGRADYVITQTPQVWLDHMVREDLGRLMLSWDYVDELVPRGTIDDLVTWYQSRLATLADVDNWTTAPAESGSSISASDTLNALVDAGCRLNGAAVAIRWPGGSMTYDELNQRADELAVALQEQVPSESGVIAVAARKGWEQVVGVVGVLRAGHAYVPIDPDLPASRIDRLVELSGARAVVTPESSTVRAAWRLPVVAVAGDVPATNRRPVRRSTPASALAYVIFTSGSTGEPKGVMIDHAGAVNTIRDIVERFDVTASDRVLGVSSLSFDLSVFDIFGTLSTSATLVLPATSHTSDAAMLAELIRETGVTIWNSVPALMQLLTSYCTDNVTTDVSSLRLVMLSGDWIPTWLPDRVRGVAPDARVISLGGATEASIWSVFYEIDEVDPSWTSIPYGTAMRNQSLIVMDEDQRPCPVGQAGDLYIGGLGLSLGYIGCPDLTAQSFMIDADTGQRLYRTGDRARQGSDGVFEFLGREDLQVKIGGFRVELGEIEAVLDRHEEVQEVVVLAPTDKDGRRRLRAVVVPRASLPTPPRSTGATDRADVDAMARRLELRLEGPARRPNLSHRPRILLGTTKDIPTSGRRSARAFGTGSMTFAQLSDVISVLSRIGDGVGTFRWPSAGGLYPIQTYVWVRESSIDGLSGGTYFFDGASSALVPVTLGAHIPDDVYGPPNRALAGSCAFAVFLLSCPPAIEPVYGELAHRFETLEAGAMMQLLVDRAATADVAACPIGDLAFSAISSLLGVDDDQQLLTSVIFGVRSGSEGGAHDLPALLRAHCASRLPGYMVPSDIVVTAALPLNSNGKVDRSALSDYGAPRPEPPAMVEMTASGAQDAELCETVTQIWLQLLELDHIDIDANFFDLGADSMHLVRAQRRLQEEIGRQLTVADFLGAPTVRGLLGVLAAVEEAVDDIQSPVISPQRESADRAASTPTLRIEYRSLATLHAEGRLADVDAVAFSYLPDSLLRDTGLTPTAILDQWCDGVPVFSSRHDTPVGSIGVVTLPHVASRLYDDPNELLRSLGSAMELAQTLGAKVVSLTGLLSSASDYGRLLQERTVGRGLPIITTGHATTASSVVMTILRAMEQTGRRVADETLAVVGTGSIGMASTELLLTVSDQAPQRIVLADIPQKEQQLREFAARLDRNHGMAGRVSVVLSKPLLADEVYGASLLLGATNLPGVIDVMRLRPGTVIVDDSYPHSFDTEAAFRRFDERHDVIFAVAGLLRSPAPITEVRQLPTLSSLGGSSALRRRLTAPHDDVLPSCTLSAALSASGNGLPVTVGHVTLESSVQHYRALATLGFDSPPLRCEGRVFEEWELELFRQRAATD